ncbi:hypothetical protein IAD21_05619 [Abditibacteriota bacterium]|nr:hypothetical protein IAD21_05619 [Abditibacteriota bacterium]
MRFSGVVPLILALIMALRAHQHTLPPLLFLALRALANSDREGMPTVPLKRKVLSSSLCSFLYSVYNCNDNLRCGR